MSNGAPEPYEGGIEKPFGTRRGDARRLAVGGFALSAGIIGAGVILLMHIISMISGVEQESWYGKDFMLALASIYPGYGGRPVLSDTIIGAAYGFGEGAFFGGLFAWLYNRFTLGGSAS